MNDIEQVLEGVAADLRWMRPEPVFVGGATIGLFLDEFAKTQVRPTEDVDCVIPEIGTRSSWWHLEEQLRERRWAPEPSGPICR